MKKIDRKEGLLLKQVITSQEVINEWNLFYVFGQDADRPINIFDPLLLQGADAK